MIFLATILPRPANTAAATTGNTMDLTFPAMRPW
jgi:hypothetical protein